MKSHAPDQLVKFGVGLVCFWSASLAGAVIGGMRLDLVEIGKMGLVAAAGAAVLVVLGVRDDNPD